MFKVKDLDKRICDIEKDCDNDKTLREYIRESEEAFGMECANLDNMTDEGLNEYINFLDYLWEK